MLGTLADGNLTLAALQDPRIRGEIAGVITFYPIVDLTIAKEAGVASRPDPITAPNFLGQT